MVLKEGRIVEGPLPYNLLDIQHLNFIDFGVVKTANADMGMRS